MYEVIVLTADYEGWWFFDDWEEHVTSRFTFDTYQKMEDKYLEIYSELNHKFKLKQIGKYNITTFYNTCEIEYCDDCDEDVQIFHTPLMLINSKLCENHVNYVNPLK